jgi:hypothetical protein
MNIKNFQLAFVVSTISRVICVGAQHWGTSTHPRITRTAGTERVNIQSHLALTNFADAF